MGPTGLGLLLTAVGAGATVGTFTLASLGDFRRKGLMVLVSIVLAGVAMVLFSQSPSYGLAFPSLIVLSGGMMALSTISSAVIQGSVSDELRGRVSGPLHGRHGPVPGR